MNLADRNYAIGLYARYLKAHGPSRFHGMRLARIERLVAQAVTPYGHWGSPHYRLPFCEARYVAGALCVWKGTFYRTVFV
jgi:hypothetical protein